MGVTVDEVLVKLRADVADYNRRIADGERRFTSSMGKIEGSATRTERLVTRSMRSIAGAIGVVSAVALARGLLSIADQAKNLDAQLRLATAQTGSFGQATADVRDIAEKTRSGLSDVANLYGAFNRNAKDLGISQAEAARATQTVTQAFKISGAGASEAAQGTRQLIQAFQSGVLRGDEFNSVMENAPRLARLVAESLNIPIGQLRAMAEEGELTADKLVKAFTDRQFTKGIDQEFAQLPVTFDQAMEQVSNAAVITFGAFDRGGQFSTALANFITDGTGGMKDLEEAAEEAGINIRANFEGLRDAFQPMVEGALSAFGQIGKGAYSLREDLAQTLGVLDQILNFGGRALDSAANGLRSGVVEGARSIPGIGRFAGPLASGYLPASGSVGRSSMEARFRAGAARTQSRLVTERTLRQINSPDAWNELLGRDTSSGGPPRTVASSSKAKKRKGPSAEQLALQAERREQAFQNELAAENQDLIDARSALVNSAEILAQLEKQKIEAQRIEYNDNLASMVAQKKYTQAQADQLKALNDQIAAARTEAIDRQEAERLRRRDADIAKEQVDLSTANLKNQQDVLASQASLADTAKERHALELRILDLQFEEEKIRLQALITASERLQTSKTASEDEKRQAAAEAEIARQRLAVLPTLKDNAKAGVNRQYEGPLDAYRRELNGAGQDINYQLQQIEVDSLRKLEDGLAGAARKALGLSGALGDIVEQLIRIGLQRQLIGPIADFLFGGAGGGGSGGLLGGIISGIGSIFGGRASGGPVTAGKLYRVNEGASRGRVEGFRPAGSGTIIPLGQMAAKAGGNTTIIQQHFTLDNRYGITTPELIDYVNQKAGEARSQAVALSVEAGRKGVPSQMQRFSVLGTP